MGKDFSGVSDILGGIRLPKNVRDHLKNHEVWTKWHEIVGPELSKVTSPSSINAKTLEIHVAHQAWAQQLHFLKPSILGKIRAFCPETQIRDLMFKVAKVVPATLPEPKPERKKRSGIPIPLSERLEMTLRAIEDEDLRTSIRKAMEAEAEFQVEFR